MSRHEMERTRVTGTPKESESTVMVHSLTVFLLFEVESETCQLKENIAWYRRRRSKE